MFLLLVLICVLTGAKETPITFVSLDYKMLCYGHAEFNFHHITTFLEMDPKFVPDDRIASTSNSALGSDSGRLEGTLHGDMLTGKEYEFGLQIIHNCTATKVYVKCKYSLGVAAIGTPVVRLAFQRNLLELNHVQKYSTSCRYHSD